MDHLITLVFTRAESFGGFEDSIQNQDITNNQNYDRKIRKIRNRETEQK